jgi:predicted RND superfamily exporter protein
MPRADLRRQRLRPRSARALIARLEGFVFRWRAAILWFAVALALAALIPASRTEVTAGFDKQLPSAHPFVATFKQYQDTFFGANRVVVAVHARDGTIWRPEVLRKVLQATEAITFLDGIDRGSVTSIWTPNVFFTEITSDGFKALPLTGGEIDPQSLDPQTIAEIRSRVRLGGYTGQLVSRDETSALIVADLREPDAAAASFDYVAFNRTLEKSVRLALEDAQVEIQVIGFAKAVGDISEHAGQVFLYIAAAVALTLLAVYGYCRSVRLTVLPVLCSLMSMLWQLATLRLLGLGLDPMALLVPFLVFAIGVSHGVQQLNHITQSVARGENARAAARRSFRVLLVPGGLALLTALASFATLALIEIPAVRELALMACVGVVYKVFSNLVLLPVAASYLHFDVKYATAAANRQRARGVWMGRIGALAAPRVAWVTVAAGGAVLALSAAHAIQRQVGNVRPGVPELRESARFNRDALDIATRFDVGLDWLTVVVEVEPSATSPCLDPQAMLYVDRYASFLADVPGVVSVGALPGLVRLSNAAASEGLFQQNLVPRDPRTLGSLVGNLNYQIKGLASSDCAVQGINVYLKDQMAGTLKTVTSLAQSYADENPQPGLRVRLASGNAGLQAAVNDVLTHSELPMLGYVYGTIAVLVLLAYRRWDAVLACCVPLTIATCLGYWFLESQGIGLTVATLPVMVLATGIGVDYAFYIYSAIRNHQRAAAQQAVRAALAETGIATAFTALTLAAGTATWAFSPLQFQADMGLLLTVMFLVNMVTALAFLPATVVVLDQITQRRPRSLAGPRDPSHKL